MPYSPIEIANTFLNEFGAEQGGISHMKLQKLIYCVHGWWLTHESDSLLTENPEVWKFGPVFPSLYHELKVYGTKAISEPIKPSPFDDSAPLVSDGKVRNLINWVWQRYGHLSGMALSDMTHKEGTAWRKIAEKYKFRVPMGLKINISDARDEFNAVKNEFVGGA